MTVTGNVEKWSRERSTTYFRGQEIPAKWHLSKSIQRLDVVTACGHKVSTVLGFDTRRTDPLVKDRCGRCIR